MPDRRSKPGRARAASAFLAVAVAGGYAIDFALLTSLRSSDGAGNGLDQAAAVLVQPPMWLLLTGLLAIVRPAGHLRIARALLPVTGAAAIWATGACDAERPWLAATPLFLPPVLAALALARGIGTVRKVEGAAVAAAAALCVLPVAGTFG